MSYRPAAPPDPTRMREGSRNVPMTADLDYSRLAARGGVRSLAVAPAWHDHAACRGHAADFLDDRNPANANRAKRVCASCPVRSECLAAGMNAPVGVWGGMTTRERRALAKGNPI